MEDCIQYFIRMDNYTILAQWKIAHFHTLNIWAIYCTTFPENMQFVVCVVHKQCKQLFIFLDMQNLHFFK